MLRAELAADMEVIACLALRRMSKVWQSTAVTGCWAIKGYGPKGPDLLAQPAASAKERYILGETDLEKDTWTSLLRLPLRFESLHLCTSMEPPAACW